MSFVRRLPIQPVQVYIVVADSGTPRYTVQLRVGNTARTLTGRTLDPHEASWGLPGMTAEQNLRLRQAQRRERSQDPALETLEKVAFPDLRHAMVAASKALTEMMGTQTFHLLMQPEWSILRQQDYENMPQVDRAQQHYYEIDSDYEVHWQDFGCIWPEALRQGDVITLATEDGLLFPGTRVFRRGRKLGLHLHGYPELSLGWVPLHKMSKRGLLIDSHRRAQRTLDPYSPTALQMAKRRDLGVLSARRQQMLDRVRRFQSIQGVMALDSESMEEFTSAKGELRSLEAEIDDRLGRVRK